MEFVNKEPQKGDHIRVSRGIYYHHGIYIGDDRVIQFGSPTNELDPNTAEVLESSLSDFLKGGTLEVATYNDEELKKIRTADEIVAYAKSKLGTKGYNIISNNCEHFANECVFGEKKSEQVDNIMGIFASLFR